MFRFEHLYRNGIASQLRDYGGIFLNHLSDNDVDLSDLYVDLSENYVELSDNDVDLSDIKLTSRWQL